MVRSHRRFTDGSELPEWLQRGRIVYHSYSVGVASSRLVSTRRSPCSS